MLLSLFGQSCADRRSNDRQKSNMFDSSNPCGDGRSDGCSYVHTRRSLRRHGCADSCADRSAQRSPRVNATLISIIYIYIYIYIYICVCVCVWRRWDGKERYYVMNRSFDTTDTHLISSRIVLLRCSNDASAMRCSLLVFVCSIVCVR